MFQLVKWARRGLYWRLVFKWLMLDLIHVLNLVLLAAFGFSNLTRSRHIHNDGLGQIQHSTAWVKSMFYPFSFKFVDFNGSNDMGNLWNMPHWKWRLFDWKREANRVTVCFSRIEGYRQWRGPFLSNLVCKYIAY